MIIISNTKVTSIFEQTRAFYIFKVRFLNSSQKISGLLFRDSSNRFLKWYKNRISVWNNSNYLASRICFRLSFAVGISGVSSETSFTKVIDASVFTIVVSSDWLSSSLGGSKSLGKVGSFSLLVWTSPFPKVGSSGVEWVGGSWFDSHLVSFLTSAATRASRSASRLRIPTFPLSVSPFNSSKK